MQPKEFKMQGQVLVAGRAAGTALVLPEPLSLWGGLDPDSGEIIDRRHPNSGAIVTGKVLVLPAGRGSSSASSVLLEAVRMGTAPAAIITMERDAILALGAAVSSVLYQKAPPTLVLAADEYQRIQTGHGIQIEYSGKVTVTL